MNRIQQFLAFVGLVVLVILIGFLYYRRTNQAPLPPQPSATPTQTATVTPPSTAPPSITPSASPTPEPSPSPSKPATPSATPALPTPKPIATPTSSPKPSPIPSPSPKQPTKTYIVVKGDTLSSIARKFGMSLAQLLALNPQISNPNLIYPGQAITVIDIAAPTPPSMARVVYRISTTKPVVFLTIDDGIYREPRAAELMKSRGLVATFFLTYSLIKDNPVYFSNLSKSTGSVIEGHTYSHQNMITLSYAEQKAEIKKGLDSLQATFGWRPVLVRPPYGNFNDNTRLAAAAVGIHTLVLWDVTVDGGKLEYAASTHLRPGDIVLMHFRPTLTEDIQAFSDAMKAQGLHTELLENWL